MQNEQQIQIKNHQRLSSLQEGIERVNQDKIANKMF